MFVKSQEGTVFSGIPAKVNNAQGSQWDKAFAQHYIKSNKTYSFEKNGLDR